MDKLMLNDVSYVKKHNERLSAITTLTISLSNVFNCVWGNW